MNLQSLREKCQEAGQGQLLQFWDQLNVQQQEDLATQIKKMDLQAATRYFASAKLSLERVMSAPTDDLEPPDPGLSESVSDSSEETMDKYRHLGLTAIGNNEVAVILMAGGQGSRLGCSCPMGMYDVGLPSGKTLYQLQAERIIKLQWMAEAVTGRPCCIPWYIMTSDATRSATANFLHEHHYFGLKKENVILFDQGMLPCFDVNGSILMESPHKMALAPAGNGDLYRALREEGALEDLLSRGVKHVHVYSVDNILLRLADPVFIGYCLSTNLALGAKVIEKILPNEPLSVVGKANGKYRVLHYHELKSEVAQRRRPDGKLLFRAGVMGDLLYFMEFLQHLCLPENESQLQHHVAKKTIPFIDSNGHQQHPASPNGVKLEKFLFDDFNFSQKLGMWQVIREEEFAPLKNADGHQCDTPTSCRQAVFNLHHRYVLSAGGKFVKADGTDSPITQSECSLHHTDGPAVCEISPLVSYAGEGLEEVVSGRTFVPPLVIELGPDNKSIVVKQGKEASQASAQ